MSRTKTISFKLAQQVFPEAAALVLPVNVPFSNTPSVWENFYSWVAQQIGESSTQGLHNRIVAGAGVMQALRLMEESRLSRKGFFGARLQSALIASDLNAGPQELAWRLRFRERGLLVWQEGDAPWDRKIPLWKDLEELLRRLKEAETDEPDEDHSI